MITFARAVQLYQAIRQGTQLLMMIALAKLVVDLTDIGNFESLRYLGYALTVFWLNGLGNAYLRIRQTTQHPERWFTYFLLLLLLGGILVFGLVSSATPVLGQALLDSGSIQYGLPFATYLLGSIVSLAVAQEAIGDGATWRLLSFSITSFGLQLLLFVSPLLLGWPIYYAMWGLAATAVYNLSWAAARYFKKRDGQLPLKPERTKFWSVATGLSAYGLTAIVVVAVDHALVTYLSDTPQQSLALWRYGAQELPLIVGVLGGLNATALKEGQDGLGEMAVHLKRRSRKAMRLFLPLAIVLVATSRWWYPWVLSPEFYPAHAIFNTMLLLVPSRLVLTTPGLISLDAQHRMTSIGMFSNVVNALVSLSLVWWLGLLGIAIGTVVAFSLERYLYVRLLNKRGIPVSDYLDVREWSLYVIVLIVFYLLATDFSALLPG